MNNSKIKFYSLSTGILAAILLFNGCNKSTSSKESSRNSGVEAHSVQIRMAAYNVLFGNWGTPERVGEMFKPYDFDIISFSEVPEGDWTARVGKELGMEFSYTGKISSANHVDKFKSILSRTPLSNQHEIEIIAEGG